MFIRSLGGGKDLATATGIANIKDEKPADAPSNIMVKGQGGMNSKDILIYLRQ